MIKIDWHGNAAWVQYWSLNIATGKYDLEWTWYGGDGPEPPPEMTNEQRAVLRQTIELLESFGV